MSDHSLLALYGYETFFCDKDALYFWGKVYKKAQIGEQFTMKMKPKIHKYRIREIIKVNNILRTSRCIGMKEKTSMRYTFFNVEF